jgi:hypothetical protein
VAAHGGPAKFDSSPCALVDHVQCAFAVLRLPGTSAAHIELPVAHLDDSSPEVVVKVALMPGELVEDQSEGELKVLVLKAGVGGDGRGVAKLRRCLSHGLLVGPQLAWVTVFCFGAALCQIVSGSHTNSLSHGMEAGSLKRRLTRASSGSEQLRL